MATDPAEDLPLAGDATVEVPASVVYRHFPNETVVLNLQTGRYHGLNPTAGRMLEALDSSPDLRTAAAAIAAEYGEDEGVVERDLSALCRDLAARELIAIALP